MMKTTFSVPGVTTAVTSAGLASLPAASNTGRMVYVSDVGESGTVFQSNGTRWRPLNGQASLKSQGAPVSGIAGTETIVLQTLLPANTWQTNDTLRIWITTTKSGATDSLLMNARIGTAGTVADTVVTGLSAFALMGATGLSGGGIFDLKLLSATSAQKVGSNGNNTMAYQPSTASAIAAATVITDASLNALYLSVSIRSSSTTDTVGITSGTIQLITP